MTKKNKTAIARLLTMVFSIIVITLTIVTISISLDLISISDEIINSESLRTNPDGIRAANAIYEENTEYRNSIYNSKYAYIRWYSTSGKIVQISVGFTLVALSGFLIYLWYTYYSKKRIISRRKRIGVKNEKYLRSRKS